jgi:hypothetical protein
VKKKNLPRLQSSHDLESSATTLMTDVVSELARLSDLANVPTMSHPLGPEMQLTEDEARVVSLIGHGHDLAAILRLSPVAEEATLQIIARLVTIGTVAIGPRARG